MHRPRPLRRPALLPPHASSCRRASPNGVFPTGQGTLAVRPLFGLSRLYRRFPVIDRIQAMRTFIRIVDTNSFTRAAQSLDMPRATATTLVQNLEAMLGTT